MANKTMHHAVIGADTFELIDEAGREETSQLKNALIVSNASGAIASFPDGGDGFAVRDLSVQMEPVQDLHGQANPWPEGGGVNKANLIGATPYTDGTYGMYVTVDTTEETITVAGTWTNNSTAGSWRFLNVPNIENGLGLAYFELSSGSHITNLTWDSNNQRLVLSVTGMTKETAYTIKFRIVAYEGDTAPTEWTPYSNICPISGRDSVTVTRTGKNLLEPKFYDGFRYDQKVGSSVVYSGGIVDITDSVTKTGDTYTKSGASWSVPMNMILYVNRQFWGKTVKFSGTIDHISGFRSAYYVVDSNDILLAKSGSMSEDPTWTITIPENTAYIVWFLNTSSAGTMKLTNPMIELGSTATAFEPYNGQQVTIQLGQTVYGGTLDVKNGTLTVTMAVLELNTLTWIAVSNNRWSSSDALSNAKPPSSNSTPANAVCSMYKIYSNDHLIGADIGICISVDKYIRVKNGSTTETPTGTFVYELAQPVTVQLTPQQMTTLLGQNNVWSDSDSVSVDYVADTKLYIEQLTEPDADMVADMNITSGRYFMVGNSLYLATANIANGAAITVGVNCTRTSLAEALNAINS